MWNGPLISLVSHLARAVWRGWRARPGIALLNIAGIAIGVAVYLAIQIVNHSATRSFEAGLDLVAGRSHLEVTAGKGGLDEICWPAVAAVPGVAACSGIVEGYATIPSHPGEYLRIVGIDLFSAAPFQVGASAGASWRDDPEAWMAEGGKLVISSAMAARLARQPGDSLVIRTGGRTSTVTIAAVAPEEGDGVTRVGFMDIGWAQELLGSPGKLSSLQIICTTPESADAVAAAIAPILPQGTRVEPPERRNRQVGLMLQGFQLNLTALSLVSLLVGVFLTGSTIAASVVRQRREIGILRAVGASQGQVRGLFLAEALIAALAGGLLAVPLARWLAGSLLGAVSQTISAHYVQMSIDRSYLSWWHVLQAVGCGLAAALAGAWLPACEASGADPVKALQPGRGIEARRTITGTSRVLLLAALGLLIALGLCWQSLQGGPPWLSFGGCLFLVLSFVLLARPATRLMAALAARAAARSDAVLLRLGAEHLERSLHRAAPVVAALLTAVAMVLGVSIMIHSFRGTLQLWVNGTLRADLYIAPAANEIVRHSDTLPDGLVDFLQAQQGTASVETLTEEPVTLADGNEYMLRAVSRSPDHPLPFMGRNPAAASKAWFQPGYVAVSEILAARIAAQQGDLLTIPTPAGPQSFTVAGIFYDYADDRGCLYMTEPTFAQHWPNRRHHAVAVFLSNPSTAPTIEDSVRSAFSKSGELSTFQNQRLRDHVFTIFDQTFAVTGLLRIIAIAVAVLGIAMALSTLVAERRREIAALRSIGSSKPQIAGIHLSEAGLIGLTAALLGMICGVLLAMILTWVVNRAFFGWTVRFSIPWSELLLTPLWVTASAVLAGLIPAWHAAGAEPADALRAT